VVRSTREDTEPADAADLCSCATDRTEEIRAASRHTSVLDGKPPEAGSLTSRRLVIALQCFFSDMPPA